MEVRNRRWGLDGSSDEWDGQEVRFRMFWGMVRVGIGIGIEI